MSNLPKLSDRFFGDLEAFDEAQQNRDFFYATFVAPASIDPTTLSNRRKFIVVGRKGVGKTAIQMKLANDLRDQGYFIHHFRFAYDLRSDDYTQVARSQSEVTYTSVQNNKDIFLFYDFRDVWERVILQRVADTLVHEGHSNPFTSFVSPTPSVLRNVFDGISRTLTVSLEAGMGPAALSVGVDLSKFGQSEIPIKIYNRIARQLFKSCCVQFQMYFFIDELVFSRLDAQDDSVSLKAALVRDIIRSAWELNQFCAQTDLAFHFICSLRPEVRNIINDRDSEAGKYLDGKDVLLTWYTSGEDEEGVLLETVFKLKVEKSYFRHTPLSEFISDTIVFNDRQQSLYEFLKRNSWGRPRDVVRFLLAVQKMSPGTTSVGEQEIKASLDEYSRASAKELVDELGVRYGPPILQALRKGITRRVYNDKQELWDALPKAELSQYSPSALMDEFFTLGLYGGYEPRLGRHYWAHRGESYLKPNVKLRIHPALWHEFSIRST